MENAYSSIVVVDLESDGSNGNLTIMPSRDELNDEMQYTGNTSCTLPSEFIYSGKSLIIVSVI